MYKGHIFKDKWRNYIVFNFKDKIEALDRRLTHGFMQCHCSFVLLVFFSKIDLENNYFLWLNDKLK